MNLNPQDCSHIKDQVYRSLCQTLANPTNRDGNSPRAFTGLPATDILILNNLSDLELINTCASNKYVNELCNNESFWLNRVIKRYGASLGSGENMKQYLPDGTTWKQYYIWLRDLDNDIVKMYQTEQMFDRSDLTILLDHPGYLNNNAHAIISMLDNYGSLANAHSISTPRIIAIVLIKYEKIHGRPSPSMREILNNGFITEDKLSPERIAILQNPHIIEALKQEKERLLSENGF